MCITVHILVQPVDKSPGMAQIDPHGTGQWNCLGVGRSSCSTDHTQSYFSCADAVRSGEPASECHRTLLSGMIHTLEDGRTRHDLPW